MIQLRGIHKAYRDGEVDNAVLRGVDLNVAQGEFVALMGASGSGKTTLLNITGGLDREYRGEATVDGRTISGLSDEALSKYRNETVAFVFQQFHLLPHMPVLNNVAMPHWFRPANETMESLLSRAMHSLERVGLAHKAHARPSHLSGGEKQRVAIARAIFGRPKVLLCDEPTGALDTENEGRILSLFQSLHEDDGMTILMVTHDPQVAARCERIVRIQDGQVVAADAKGEL